MGAQRLLSQSSVHAPLFGDGSLNIMRSRELVMHDLVRRCGGESEARAILITLLDRAQRLSQFVEHNVGPTHDWPVRISADSVEAEDEFGRLVEELSTVTTFLLG